MGKADESGGIPQHLLGELGQPPHQVQPSGQPLPRPGGVRIMPVCCLVDTAPRSAARAGGAGCVPPARREARGPQREPAGGRCRHRRALPRRARSAARQDDEGAGCAPARTRATTRRACQTRRDHSWGSPPSRPDTPQNDISPFRPLASAEWSTYAVGHWVSACGRTAARALLLHCGGESGCRAAVKRVTHPAHVRARMCRDSA